MLGVEQTFAEKVDRDAGVKKFGIIGALCEADEGMIGDAGQYEVNLDTAQDSRLKRL